MLTKLTTDLNIVQGLNDQPNAVTGLTAAEVKAKFDEAGNDIKTFINDTLIDELDTILYTPGGTTAEVIEARKGKVNLKAKIDEIDSSLADIATTKSYASGQDVTTELQNILDLMPIGSKLLLKNQTISILGNLTVPVGIDIIGQNTTITIKGSITLNGKNVLKNITFLGDKSNKKNSIIVNGSNVYIQYNEFSNFKSIESGESVVILVNPNLKNVEINYNTFDGIEPYSENAIEGDSLGEARAITTWSDCKIYGNTFKNLIGYEDGDYIKVNSSYVDYAQFPFGIAYGASYDGYHDYLDVIISNNTFYQNQCKSSVKIQASGCEVKGNTFIFTNDGAKLSYAIVRGHGIKDIDLKDNKIFLQSDKLYQPFVFQWIENCYIEDSNKIFVSVNLASTFHAFYIQQAKNFNITNNYIQWNDYYAGTTDLHSLFCYVDVDGLNIERNKIQYKQGNTAVEKKLIEALDNTYPQYHVVSNNVNFNDNDVLLDSADVTSQFIKYIFKRTNKISCKRNKLKSLSENITSLFGLGNCDDINIKNNDINNVKSYLVYCDDYVTNLDINNNDIKNTGLTIGTFLRMGYNCSNVNISKNNIYSSITSNLFFSADASFSYSTLKYEPGINLILWFDYGQTAQRNKASKSIGFKFYDTTINKPIWWNGTIWVDSTGAAA